MYHEVTYAELKRRRNKRILLAVVIVAILAALTMAVFVMRASAREQGVLSTREAIMSAAKQCCAVEGSFPTTLEHLEDHYGLVVNEDDYRVMYEWLGDNVAPSVVVVPR